MGFHDQSDSVPGRGARVAGWVENYMQRRGLSLGELAFQTRVDKRDLRRLLNDRSCGWRLEDALASLFGWDFIEAVMTPVVGADPLQARERELEQRLAEAAALHARLEREHAARKGVAPAASVRLVAGRKDKSLHPQLGR